jgi:EmrB/QacA subfamily drug resistance transporter
MTTSAPAAAQAGTARLTPRLRLILAVVLVADVLDLMDSTITNIAAPTIVAHLGGGQSLVKWLGASYAMALGVLLVAGGRLGDRYGKRRLFLIGIAGFGLASLLCAVSVTPAMLISARLAQGAFGALLIPQGISVLMSTFSREQFPAAATAFGPVLGASAVLGPIVAGLIISANIAGQSWRPLFGINIVLCLIGFLAAYRLLPHDAGRPEQSIDVLGAGLLGLSMLGLIFGLIQGPVSGWSGPAILALIAGGVFFGLCCVRQATAASPLIQSSLLKNRGFTSGLLLGLAYFAAVNGFAYVVSLFFQLSLRLSPARAAFGLAPLMVGIIGSSLAARPLMPRLGRTLVVTGLLISLAGAGGLLVTTVLAGHVTAWTMAPAVFVLGLGMGACFSSIYDLAVGDVRPAEAGSASGSLSAVQQLAAAIGSAVITTVFFGQLQHGGVPALRVSVAVVAGITVLCLALVWLMPKSAPADQH